MDYTVESTKSFEQAATALEAAVKGNAFAENCKVFEVCNPGQAAKVLSTDMRLNMALPCRISVYTEQGKTMIGMIKPGPMLAALSRDASLVKVAQEVEAKTKKMIEEAK